MLAVRPRSSYLRLGFELLLRIYRAVHLLLIANAHDADPYGRDDAVGLAAALLN